MRLCRVSGHCAAQACFTPGAPSLRCGAHSALDSSCVVSLYKSVGAWVLHVISCDTEHADFNRNNGCSVKRVRFFLESPGLDMSGGPVVTLGVMSFSLVPDPKDKADHVLCRDAIRVFTLVTRASKN